MYIPSLSLSLSLYIYIYIYRSEGFPRTVYFVPACVGSGRWADFESCSRIHACGFRCFEGKIAFWGGICKSRPEPIGVREF